MLVAEKPPLDDDLLMHFGVRGMKWGVRKERDTGGSGGSGGTAAPKKMSTGKKVAIGLGVAAAGAATAAYLLKKRGSVKVSTARQVTTSFKAFKPSELKSAHTPSPFEMRLSAGQAAHRTAMSRIATQKLTDKAWRDSAMISRMSREMDESTANLLNFNAQALRR